MLVMEMDIVGSCYCEVHGLWMQAVEVKYEKGGSLVAFEMLNNEVLWRVKSKGSLKKSQAV